MIDPTKKATTLPDFRMRFLRLYFGATDERDDNSVPEKRRARYREHVEYHKQYAESFFERICNNRGATDGTWATVPDDRRADVIARVERGVADFTNRCEFELDLYQIELEEQAEADFAEALKVP